MREKKIEEIIRLLDDAFDGSANDFCLYTKSRSARAPIPSAQVEAVVYGGRLYVIGGNDVGVVRWLDDVYFAEINPDGTVNSWIPTSSLPEPRAGHRSVVWGNFVYVLGGDGPPPTGRIERDTVWFAAINPDGTLGAWTTTTSLPYAASQPVAAVWNGRIYFGGGWTGGSWRNDVYYAEINPDGSLGSWIPTTSLPEPRRVAYDDRIYVIGGESSGSIPVDTVYYAIINPDGSIGAWSTTTPIPNPRTSASTALVDGELYVTGGHDGVTVYDTVFHATINPDGTLGSWQELQTLPEPRSHHDSAAFEDKMYVIGGYPSLVEGPRDMHACAAHTQLKSFKQSCLCKISRKCLPIII